MDAYLGDIRMFAGNYAPRNYALCDGQLLAISEFDALFALLGTTYGGDGRTNFGLPDLRGRLPVGQGRGPGLSDRRNGQRIGMPEVPLSIAQVPPHTHTLQGSTGGASTSNPDGKVLGKTPSEFYDDGATPEKVVEFAPQAIGNSGEVESHYNMMPSLCINFIICIIGLFPPRT